MPKWLDELDELLKGLTPEKPKGKDKDDDGYDDDDEDDGDEGMPFGKSASVKVDKYEPADNGDDDDEESGAAVRDPEKIERLTRGGKIKKPAGCNAGTGMVKSVRDVVDGDTVDAINAADALGAIADACDAIFAGFAKSFRQITRRLDQVEQGQALIGQGVTKSLQGTAALVRNLRGELEQVAQQPRGRKGMVKSVERQFTGNKGGAPAPANRQELMQKSMKALKKGLLTAVESASIDVFVNNGHAVPDDLMAKINAAD